MVDPTDEEPQPTPDLEGPPGPFSEEAALKERVRALHESEPHHAVRGHAGWQSAGLTLFLAGILVYLHGAWTTANAVLDGSPTPDQIVSLGPLEVLEGTLGIALAVLGAVLYVVFTQVPIRIRPLLKPDTLDYFVAVEDALRERRMARIATWTGSGLLVLGVLLVGYALRRTAADGELYVLVIGDLGYRLHVLGYVFVGIALLVFATLAFRPGPGDDLLAHLEAQARGRKAEERARGAPSDTAR